jgi:hypothetical protein
MDNLSQELIDYISNFLDYDDLKNILTVSPKFQVAAESRSKAFEKFNITEDNAEDFLRIYSGRRLHYLRRIRFRPTLPELNSEIGLTEEEDGEPTCRESKDDLHRDDEVFTSQIAFLFSTLQRLEESIHDSKRNYPCNLRLTIYTPTRLMDQDAGYCHHRAYVSWPVHLLSPEELPAINIIRALVFKNDVRLDPLRDVIEQVQPSTRSLDLKVVLDLANKLSGLELLRTRLGGEVWQSHISWASECAIQYRSGWDGPHRDSRHSFADAATTLGLPSGLKQADLDFLFPLDAVDNMDHRQKMPDLAKETTKIYDRFSAALRILSYPLRRLNVQGSFDATLFQSLDGGPETPFWPNLEVLQVSFHPASPSGAWYFRGVDPEPVTRGFAIESSHYQPLAKTPEDEHFDVEFDYPEWNMPLAAQFRTVPVSDTLEPFLSAFATATKAMPSLKQAALWSPLKFHPSDVDGGAYASPTADPNTEHLCGQLAWGLAYTSPGASRNFYTAQATVASRARQIWWSTGDWQPSAQLGRLIRDIGQGSHGGEVVQHRGHERVIQGLGSRSAFEGLKGRTFGY